jgi:hypothetical protein
VLYLSNICVNYFLAFDSVFYASQKLKEEEENREEQLHAAKV